MACELTISRDPAHPNLDQVTGLKSIMFEGSDQDFSWKLFKYVWTVLFNAWSKSSYAFKARFQIK